MSAEEIDVAAYERARHALDVLEAALSADLSPEDEAAVVAHAASILRRREAVRT